jgi:hypothetical protein
MRGQTQPPGGSAPHLPRKRRYRAAAPSGPDEPASSTCKPTAGKRNVARTWPLNTTSSHAHNEARTPPSDRRNRRESKSLGIPVSPISTQLPAGTPYGHARLVPMKAAPRFRSPPWGRPDRRLHDRRRQAEPAAERCLRARRSRGHGRVVDERPVSLLGGGGLMSRTSPTSRARSALGVFRGRCTGGRLFSSHRTSASMMAVMGWITASPFGSRLARASLRSDARARERRMPRPQGPELRPRRGTP